MGHEAEYWEYGTSRFGFKADRRIDVSGADPTILWQAFLEAKDRFDVFHFHFANSFFPYPWAVVPPYWDLPVLRMLGKKVFFTFHGSDCRVKKIAEEWNPYAAEFFADTTPDDDRLLKSINVIKTYANKMFAVSRELLRYVPDAQAVPRAIDLSLWPEQPVAQRKRPLVVHLPSRRSYKGTPRILAGLESLQREGASFDFELREDLSHDEARALFRRADVVIDNILMGDFGVTSIEAMASAAVPVAYLEPRIRQGNKGIPVYEVEPETFVDRMRALVGDVRLRTELASRGRAYVQEHFDASVVARDYLALYEADFPPLTPRVFPDWMGFADVRRLETLTERVDELRAELARTSVDLRLASGELAQVKTALEFERSKPWTPKDMLPPAVRSRLASVRSRARGKRVSGPNEVGKPGRKR
jgi:glycosyltransferase involved in cell wall biosynthesis